MPKVFEGNVIFLPFVIILENYYILMAMNYSLDQKLAINVAKKCAVELDTLVCHIVIVGLSSSQGNEIRNPAEIVLQSFSYS